MPSEQMSGIKRFLLWDYPRTSWQYDLMVALILAFIFLSPRAIFKDQPRAASVTEVPSERGRTFLLEPKLLESTPEREREPRAQSLIRSRYGSSISVKRVEALHDLEKELTGFMVFAQQ